MPIIDPDQGVPLPTGTDLADNPAAFSNFYTPVLSRQNNRYTDEANRTALHPANIDGEESYLTATNRKERNTGAAWISSFVSSNFTYARKAADQTVNNSTVLVNVTDLVSPLPVAGMFGFRVVLFHDSATAADIKFAFTWPAGASARWGVQGIAVGAAGTTGDGQFGTATVSGASVAVGGAGVGSANTLLSIIEGGITMGGTAGNLQLQFAQQTADLSDAIIRFRSRIIVWRES
jgi:hypothetical protein